MRSTLPMSIRRPSALLVALTLLLGNLIPFASPSVTRAAPTELFFSEYVEGSSFNKALEIYNGTGAPIDLAAGAYTLELYSNGSPTASQAITLSGTVAAGDVFVISHGSAADSTIIAQRDATSSLVINFTGNDAVVLRKGGIAIDVVGQIGFDPGTEWGSGLTSTQDNTLRRKSSIEVGDGNGGDAFDPATEWNGFPNNSFGCLGSHLGPEGVGAATPTSAVPGDTTTLTVTVTPGTNPVSTGLAVTADLTPIGGLGLQPFRDDGMSGDAVAGDNVFTYVATVAAVPMGQKTMTATVTDTQARSCSTTISLFVQGGTSPTGVGAANPPVGQPGETITLTVAVTPGTNPASTGLAVRADLSPIGGSSTQAFLDDGLNGDTTAGDHVFTHVATLGAVAVGHKTMTATISDAQTRSGSTTINFLVEGVATAIWEIQGASHVSSYDDDQVFGVEGVVTATRNSTSLTTLGGFWMVDPTPDSGPGSDLTSDGIFVFRRGNQSDGSGPIVDVAVGDLVRVSGVVDEFSATSTNLTTTLIGTQAAVPAVTVISSGNALPETVIGVDRIPPGEVIDNDSTSSVNATGAVYDPAQDGIDFWESLEGMRLSVADAVAVGPTNGFDEIAVVSQLTSAGQRTPRGGLLVRQLGAAGDYRPGDFNPERLILDDVIAEPPDMNVGDTFTTDPVGVLDYGFGNFKLYITEAPGRVPGPLQPEETADDGLDELSVATFNVENLSPLDTNAKVARLATQIVENLQAPDIIAVQEVQDNTGAPSTDVPVVAADLSWERLIDAIVAAGGPRYEYRQIDPEHNADGGAPNGNIRVGFLFLPSADLRFVDRPGGTATADTDVVRAPRGGGPPACGGKAQLTLSPGRITDASVGGADAFFETRKSLAGEFCFRGRTVFLVANHFSSKGDDRPLFGHFQPPFRFTEFQSGTPEDGWRHAQAQAINDFVDEILEIDKQAHVIVLGDINDFDFSETVDILAGERVAQDPGPFLPDADGSGQTAPTGERPILRSLFELLPAKERYSYVFDGNSQVLDQILVSTSIWHREPAYDVVHVNAEFFDQASDHDPSVMVVRLQEEE